MIDEAIDLKYFALVARQNRIALGYCSNHNQRCQDCPYSDDEMGYGCTPIRVWNRASWRIGSLL